MGAGIAQVAARAGYQVVLRDVTAEFLETGMTAIDQSLTQARMGKKGLVESSGPAVVVS